MTQFSNARLWGTSLKIGNWYYWLEIDDWKLEILVLRTSGCCKIKLLCHFRHRRTGNRAGVRNLISLGKRFGKIDQRRWKSCIWKGLDSCVLILNTTRHVKPRGKQPRPRGKAKYSKWPIVNEYREGKVKSTPGGEWKRTWNHMLTSTRRASPFVMIK